jgi:hypothetical protein
LAAIEGLRMALLDLDMVQALEVLIGALLDLDME